MNFEKGAEIVISIKGPYSKERLPYLKTTIQEVYSDNTIMVENVIFDIETGSQIAKKPYIGFIAYDRIHNRFLSYADADFMNAFYSKVRLFWDPGG